MEPEGVAGAGGGGSSVAFGAFLTTPATGAVEPAGGAVLGTSASTDMQTGGAAPPAAALAAGGPLQQLNDMFPTLGVPTLSHYLEAAGGDVSRAVALITAVPTAHDSPEGRGRDGGAHTMTDGHASAAGASATSPSLPALLLTHYSEEERKQAMHSVYGQTREARALEDKKRRRMLDDDVAAAVADEKDEEPTGRATINRRKRDKIEQDLKQTVELINNQLMVWEIEKRRGHSLTNAERTFEELLQKQRELLSDALAEIKHLEGEILAEQATDEISNMLLEFGDGKGRPGVTASPAAASSSMMAGAVSPAGMAAAATSTSNSLLPGASASMRDRRVVSPKKSPFGASSNKAGLFAPPGLTNGAHASPLPSAASSSPLPSVLPSTLSSNALPSPSMSSVLSSPMSSAVATSTVPGAGIVAPSLLPSQLPGRPQ